MNNTLGVCGFKSTADLRHDVRRFAMFEFFLSSEHALQIFALDVLHGDELDPVGLPEIKDSNDIPVGNLSRKNYFLFEAFENLRICGHVRANDFQRDFALQFTVASFIDRSHPALAE